MRRLFVPCCFAALALVGLRLADGEFSYDVPERVEASHAHGSPGAYDGDLLVDEDQTLQAYLRFVPGEGDVLVAELGGGFTFESEPGRYAGPRLTAGRDGVVWLTYEARPDDMSHWNVYVRSFADGTLSDAEALGAPSRTHLSHDAAAEPGGGLRVVWQSEVDGQFEVVTTVVGSDGEVELLSSSPFGDWRPRLTITPEAMACVVWDSFDGVSFNLVGRRHHRGVWSPIEELAASSAFEGRASIAGDSTGRVYVAFEQGEENWGREYRSVSTLWNNVTDDRGPLHRLRRVRLAEWRIGAGLVAAGPALPMASLERARAEERREGVDDLGVFYERPELAVDGKDRPWVVYRHYVELQLGRDEPVKHHIEQGWTLYARCLTRKGWGPLLAFDRAQRDGCQRLSLSPAADGVAALWATGRTDRHDDPLPRGLARADVSQPKGRAPSSKAAGGQARFYTAARAKPPARPATETVGDVEFELVFGDLHRHTDLSLCFPFFDGSLDDAYRYGIEVARLDFLAVTDHARDIDQGDVQSQLWWRTIKAVERHRLGTAFFPFFAFERSQGATDHNVISLRDDMLRSHKPPLPEFWAEIQDGNTITIPHNTIPQDPFCGKVWEWHDDERRPLVEVYQGFRDRGVDVEAQEGLDKGYHMGFIASSDHLSTSGSYACVWTPDRDHEAIFRSMQARRTFGATAPIRLVVRAGEAWMGERIVAERWPVLSVEIDGTAPIAKVELVRDGEVVEVVEPGSSSYVGSLHGPDAPAALEGESWSYVRVLQEDGNRAWSSPIWARPAQ